MEVTGPLGTPLGLAQRKRRLDSLEAAQGAPRAFGNMDSDRVEARKSLLESFLKVSILCCHCSHQTPRPRWETWAYIPGLGRSPGEGKGYPLQYSGLDNFI